MMTKEDLAAIRSVMLDVLAEVGIIPDEDGNDKLSDYWLYGTVRNAVAAELDKRFGEHILASGQVVENLGTGEFRLIAKMPKTRQ